jgi:hypothetical protein
MRERELREDDRRHQETAQSTQPGDKRKHRAHRERDEERKKRETLSTLNSPSLKILKSEKVRNSYFRFHNFFMPSDVPSHHNIASYDTNQFNSSFDS